MTSTPTATTDLWDIAPDVALHSVYSSTETAHGRYGVGLLNLPPAAIRPPGPIADAMAELERRYAQRDDARTRIRALRSQATRAVELDRDAAAAAVAVGNKIPAATAQKARTKLEATERELPAIQASIIDAFRTLLDALDEHGQAWLADADRDRDEAARRYAAAAAELDAARHGLCAAIALPAWLTAIRDRSHVASFHAPLVDLPTGWRNRFDITTLLDALRADVDQFTSEEAS